MIKIAIIVHGGVVESVFTDHEEEGIDVEVIDTDRGERGRNEINTNELRAAEVASNSTMRSIF